MNPPRLVDCVGVADTRHPRRAMRFRPSLDGYYKNRWSGNSRFEEVKRRMRCGEEGLGNERDALERELSHHMRACYADLYLRTDGLLSNPTWRRLVLLSKWSSLQRSTRRT